MTRSDNVFHSWAMTASVTGAMRAYRMTGWAAPPAAVQIPVPAPGPGQVLVRVAGCGLCRSDLQWRRNHHDHGAALAHDLGYTPVYLHYNSGLHISVNGRQFAAQLEALVGEEARDATGADLLGVDDPGVRPELGADPREQGLELGTLKLQLREHL